jgi:hypothetical protein
MTPVLGAQMLMNDEGPSPIDMNPCQGDKGALGRRKWKHHLGRGRGLGESVRHLQSIDQTIASPDGPGAILVTTAPPGKLEAGSHRLLVARVLTSKSDVQDRVEMLVGPRWLGEGVNYFQGGHGDRPGHQPGTQAPKKAEPGEV